MKKFRYDFEKHEGKPRKVLVVRESVHNLVKVYSIQNRITVLEAAHILLGKGLAQAYEEGVTDTEHINYKLSPT